MSIEKGHWIQYVLLICIICYANLVAAEERIDMQGLSITGNKELPNVLYILPWKSADLPDMQEPPLATLIDAALQPVDRQSILREELYYKIINTDTGKATNDTNKLK
jgi:hypothetical protein